MNASKLTSIPKNDLNDLETHLAGTLRPVAPRRDFVQRLRERVHLPPREEIVVRLRDWQTLVLVFGGVFSGALVILTVARAFFHLFGRRN
ncbi:MAG TPA: hypothetical protein VHM28_08105 [Anaerolineales bacterium]|nr:hypothetical protein [Anaerolineales bacterium]